ncbi:MotA/TolQ/ExbB proton channel family protein [candidate division KSB1 bacterium]|nr:MotA/TolQ/ExbB proton channel family protein [candidate division KSB1 bacterium]
MLDYIEKGGLWIMLPLVGLSIISLGFILERIWRYLRVPRGKNADKILEDVEKGIRTGDIQTTIAYCKQHKNVLTFAFLHIMERFEFLVREKRSIGEMREELLITGEEFTRAYLEEFVPVIFSISTVSPLLGLLGTILGMIKSFAAISEKGVGDPTVVSKGISEALITTATGLIVAIPSVLAYNFFRRLVEKIGRQLEPYENLFINALLRDLARFRTYKEMLKTAYRDGVLNQDEKVFLQQKRVELNISEAEAAELEREVKQGGT